MSRLPSGPGSPGSIEDNLDDDIPLGEPDEDGISDEGSFAPPPSNEPSDDEDENGGPPGNEPNDDEPTEDIEDELPSDDDVPPEDMSEPPSDNEENEPPPEDDPDNEPDSQPPPPPPPSRSGVKPPVPVAPRNTSQVDPDNSVNDDEDLDVLTQGLKSKNGGGSVPPPPPPRRESKINTDDIPPPPPMPPSSQIPAKVHNNTNNARSARKFNNVDNVDDGNDFLDFNNSNYQNPPSSNNSIGSISGNNVGNSVSNKGGNNGGNNVDNNVKLNHSPMRNSIGNNNSIQGIFGGSEAKPTTSDNSIQSRGSIIPFTTNNNTKSNSFTYNFDNNDDNFSDPDINIFPVPLPVVPSKVSVDTTSTRRMTPVPSHTSPNPGLTATFNADNVNITNQNNNSNTQNNSNAISKSNVNNAAPDNVRRSVIMARTQSITRRVCTPEEIKEIANRTLSEGYIELLGKFEGDPYEKLYMKPSKTEISIRVESGEDALFDLVRRRAFVFEDPDDPLCFVLEYLSTVVIFKTYSAKDMSIIFTSLPQTVFEVPLDDEDVMATAVHQAAKPSTSMDNHTSRANPNYKYPSDDEAEDSPKIRIKRVKGTSVEDILEGTVSGWGGNANQTGTDNLGNSQRSRDVQIMRMGAENTENRTRKNVQHRKELLDSHIKKPLYSIRRVKQLCKWINAMHIWHNNLEVITIHKELCNGVLLARLMKVLIPSASFMHLNEKPLSQKAANENLEQAIGLIRRSKCVNNSRIATAAEVMQGKTAKIIVMLQELFDVYMRQPLYTRAVKILRWFNSVLKQYRRALPDNIFSEGDLGGVWGHFQSGVALFCVIYHFYGPATIGEGSNLVTIDPLRVFSQPSSIMEYRTNTCYLMRLFRALHIEAIWDPDDWITFPDTEFVVLQLQYVYDHCANLQCSLPPAQGKKAGVTSGPNGDPEVVGMVFADSVVSQMCSLQRMSRGVLIGTGEAALPMLPIDLAGRKQSRMFSSVCPQGLISSDVKIAYADIKISDSRNTSTRKRDAMLEMLKSHHTQTTPSRQNRSTPSSSSATPKTPRDTIQSAAQGINTPNSQTVHNVTTTEPDSISKEQSDKLLQNLDDLMQQLEEDIFVSQQEMEALEEDLASRYLELEAEADSMPEEMYSQKFHDLEQEREKLEDEKSKLQDHFALRLTSIKSRHQEINAKMQGDVTPSTPVNDEHLSESPPQSAKMPDTTPKSVHFKMQSKNLTSATKSASEKKALAEKGWINIDVKTKSYNFHLSKKHNQSAKALQDMWTPPKYKVPQQVGARIPLDATSMMNYSNAGSKDESLNSTKLLSMSDLMFNGVADGEDKDVDQTPSVDKVFRNYLYKLRDVTNRWIDARNGTKRENVIGKLTPIAGPSLIALPVGHQHVDNEMTRAIRDEELAAMDYEDQRKRLWVNQHGHGNHDTISRQGSVKTEESKLDFSLHDGVIPTQAEAQAALRWLSVLRPLSLVDRRAKEYVFSVMSDDEIEGAYNFVWHEANNQEGEPVGKINFRDFKGIHGSANDGTSFILQIRDNPKALKSTGGRPTVNIMCRSSGESVKYQSCLKCLWAYLN